MRHLAGIFALLTGAAGWFYLFYSRAAHRLSGIEDQRLNARRIALRRVGGVAMLLLGGFFFAGFYALEDPHHKPAAFLAVWLSVFALLVILVVLALVDVGLTRRLRANKGRGFNVEQKTPRD
jgi:drug/metabolite transporter (DMT)-like permease